jgi:hypothetical protein
MMTLPPDDEKIVRDWIAKHWKGCPFCGDAQPGWHVQGECNLPFTYSGLPSGTRTVAGIALIPVVCANCSAICFLARTQVPGL